MKQCNAEGCSSYAVNIERDYPYDKCLCDVHHWKGRYEAAEKLLDGVTPEEISKMNGDGVKRCRELWRKMKRI